MEKLLRSRAVSHGESVALLQEPGVDFDVSSADLCFVLDQPGIPMHQLHPVQSRTARAPKIYNRQVAALCPEPSVIQGSAVNRDHMFRVDGRSLDPPPPAERAALIVSILVPNI